jgi:Zn-dependent peptidase ImmA (M78 family)
MQESLEMVDKTIEEFGSSDPYKIAEKKDFTVRSINFPEGTLGQTVRSKRFCTIFVDNKISDQLAMYVTAHELGHCLIHPGYSTPLMRSSLGGLKVPTIEREANEFAFGLLANYYDISRESNSLNFVRSLGLGDEMERFLLPSI